MHPAKQWHLEALGKAAVAALKRNGFDAHYTENSETARRAVLSMIPAGASIGFGNSVTLDETGILDLLRSGGYRLINPLWVEATMGRDERLPARRQAMTADVFLSGANAVTLDGKLVSTDATGNRVAGMIFGPKKTILVVGANKIVATVDDALDRVTNVAAPANARRLGYDTPCANTGICTDCRSPQRICNVTVILHRKPSALDLTVVVIGEELGL